MYTNEASRRYDMSKENEMYVRTLINEFVWASRDHLHQRRGDRSQSGLDLGLHRNNYMYTNMLYINIDETAARAVSNSACTALQAYRHMSSAHTHTHTPTHTGIRTDIYYIYVIHMYTYLSRMLPCVP